MPRTCDIQELLDRQSAKSLPTIEFKQNGKKQTFYNERVRFIESYPTTLMGWEGYILQKGRRKRGFFLFGEDKFIPQAKFKKLVLERKKQSGV